MSIMLQNILPSGLLLSWLKFSWAISQVKWLNSEKNQHFEDHLCPRPQGVYMDIRTLRTRTEMVFETLVFSLFNHLT